MATQRMVLDLSLNPLFWVRCPHLEQGRRLWHATVSLDEKQVITVGVITITLASSYMLKRHATNALQLRAAPSSLLKITGSHQKTT